MNRKRAGLFNIRLWTRVTMEEMLRTVEDRQRWKIVIGHDAVNPRKTRMTNRVARCPVFIRTVQYFGS